MAVIYHGSTALILTSSSYTEYPSGLMRVDTNWVIRTSSVGTVGTRFDAKTALPSIFSSYTSQFAATREDRPDGFSYFTAIGYKGNTGASRVILGAVISNLSVPVKFIQTTGQISIVQDASFPVSIISDTLTRINTIATSSSNTAISATPPSTLTMRIIKQPVFPAPWTSSQTLAAYLNATKDIININRQNYGTIDEVTVTWGFVFTFGTPFYVTATTT